MQKRNHEEGDFAPNYEQVYIGIVAERVECQIND